MSGIQKFIQRLAYGAGFLGKTIAAKIQHRAICNLELVNQRIDVVEHQIITPDHTYESAADPISQR